MRTTSAAPRHANEKPRGQVIRATIVAVMCIAPAAVLACNVPVYRYALNHWSPAAYRATVFHHGPLSDKDRERLDALEAAASSSQINLKIRLLEKDSVDSAADRALLEACPAADSTCLVLQYPESLRLDVPVWAGQFDEGHLANLCDSPVRTESLRRLATGQTAVWLFLESSDQSLNETALSTLTESLKSASAVLKLPKQDAAEPELLDGPELKIDFSVIRVRRDDPAEQTLIALLLAAEDDLKTIHEPMVFPVFGRGRALLPLIGAGITSDNIRSSAAFLIGACSCQVKDQNPGFDLLVTANWHDLIPWVKPPLVTVAAVTGPESRPAPELVTIASGGKQAEAPITPATEPDHPLSRWILIGIPLGALLIVLLRRIS